MRTFEYRLYLNTSQERQFTACLAKSRHLYNEMLERLRAEHDSTGRFLWRYDLTAAFKGRGGDVVPATVVQTLADRLTKALRRYLALKALGKPCGFPRFKTANRWHSIQLRQYGRGRDAWLDPDGKHLHVPGKLGSLVKIKLHRPIEGKPKTCYLVRRADGHWYALIVCETPGSTAAAEVGTIDSGLGSDIGLDVGVRFFLADSEGHTVANPRFYGESQARLRRSQRRLSRRHRGSQRRRKAARLVAKTHLKIARQRRDFLFKVASPYAERYRHIYVEDLNVSGLAQNHSLARSIHDAAWSEFFSILTDKAERAGHQVVKVPAHFTSQKCSGCGELVPKSLSVRTHVCPHCGLIDDRDVNAARNILALGQSLENPARAEPSGVNGCDGSRSLRSPRL